MQILEKWLNFLEKNSSKFLPWIDYLRVKIPLDFSFDFLNYFEQIICTIDDDNSNIFIDDSFVHTITWNKIYLPTGVALIGSIVFRDISVPCFCYNDFHVSNKALFNSFWKFDFYWQYFRLLEIWFIDSDFNEFFFNKFKNCQITRLDYKIDFFDYYKDKLFSSDLLIKGAINTPWQEYNTWWYVNSWRKWNKTSHTWLVRAYDKLRDINSKNKMGLYWDYLVFKNVFRLEFEFLNKWCYGFNLSDLDKLVLKCENFISFKPLNCEQYKTYDKLDLTNELHKIKYIRTAKWYFKHIIANNINAFFIIESLYFELWYTKQQIKELQKNLLIYKEKKWV